MNVTEEFAGIYDQVSENDPITVVVDVKYLDRLRDNGLLLLLGRYLHDVLHIPYSQIILLLGSGNNYDFRAINTEKLVGHDLYKKCTVIWHSKDMPGFSIGKSKAGVDVEVNPLLMRRSIILLGKSLTCVCCGKTDEKALQETASHKLNLVGSFDPETMDLEHIDVEAERERFREIVKEEDEEFRSSRAS